MYDFPWAASAQSARPDRRQGWWPPAQAAKGQPSTRLQLEGRVPGPGLLVGGVPPANAAWRLINYGFLERQLRWRLAEMTATKHHRGTLTRCTEALERVLRSLGPEWQMKLFGSCANGFSTKDSDMDATCIKQGSDESSQDLLGQVEQALKGSSNFEILETVMGARIPILKLRFDKKLECDLSCNNLETLNNTQLLLAYASLHPRVRELGILVKLWAKVEGVCGAVNGYLSAYALTVMAIYFLQVDEPCRLPCLPTHAFSGVGRPNVPEFKWSCELPLFTLLSRFFTFFTTEFRWGEEIVSVRLGRRVLAPECAQLRGVHTKRLHIEDPFLLERNLHCTLQNEQEWKFYAKLQEAAQTLQSGLVPPSLQCSLTPTDNDGQYGWGGHEQQAAKESYGGTSRPRALPEAAPLAATASDERAGHKADEASASSAAPPSAMSLLQKESDIQDAAAARHGRSSGPDPGRGKGSSSQSKPALPLPMLIAPSADQVPYTRLSQGSSQSGQRPRFAQSLS